MPAFKAFLPAMTAAPAAVRGAFPDAALDFPPDPTDRLGAVVRTNTRRAGTILPPAVRRRVRLRRFASIPTIEEWRVPCFIDRHRGKRPWHAQRSDESDVGR